MAGERRVRLQSIALLRPRRAPAPDAEKAPDRERLYPWLVAAALVVAAALRVIGYVQIHALPDATSDGLFYEEVAQKLLDGRFLREPQAFTFSPLYVFFLAGAFKIVGHNINAIRALQLVMGLGSCALIFLAGRRALGRRAALVALWLAALYVPFIHFEVQLLGIALSL